MNNTIFYKGYLICINETREDYNYFIKKDEKIVTESAQGFAFPSDAELQAKLFIDRLIAKKDGWIVS